MLAPTWQRDSNLPPPPATAEKRPSPRRAMSSRKTRSTGSSAQKASTWSSVGETVSRTGGLFHPVRVARCRFTSEPSPATTPTPSSSMGDPLRAKYIAETYFIDATPGERGARAARVYGHLGGEARLGAGHRDGLSRRATIVFEELIQLGCKRLMRVGTCGGLQPHHALGDLVVALTAVPAGRDGEASREGTSHTARLRPGTSSTAPCMPRRRSASRCTSGRSSRATCSTTRTKASTSAGRAGGCSASRWRRRLSSTVAAIGGIGKVPDVHGGCLLTVSDIIVEGCLHADHRRRAACRGRPDDAHRAHDRHVRLASPESSFSSSTRPPARRTGKRWPKPGARAAELSLRGEEVLSEFPGHLAEAAGRSSEISPRAWSGWDGTRRTRSRTATSGTDAELAEIRPVRPGLRPHARDP